MTVRPLPIVWQPLRKYFSRQHDLPAHVAGIVCHGQCCTVRTPVSDILLQLANALDRESLAPASTAAL